MKKRLSIEFRQTVLFDRLSHIFDAGVLSQFTNLGAVARLSKPNLLSNLPIHLEHRCDLLCVCRRVWSMR
jgi:hypothetical protein